MPNEHERLFEILVERRRSDLETFPPASDDAFSFVRMPDGRRDAMRFEQMLVPMIGHDRLRHQIGDYQSPDTLVYSFPGQTSDLMHAHITVEREKFVRDGRFHVTVDSTNHRITSLSASASASVSDSRTRRGRPQFIYDQTCSQTYQFKALQHSAVQDGRRDMCPQKYSGIIVHLVSAFDDYLWTLIDALHQTQPSYSTAHPIHQTHPTHHIRPSYSTALPSDIRRSSPHRIRKSHDSTNRRSTSLAPPAVVAIQEQQQRPHLRPPSTSWVPPAIAEIQRQKQLARRESREGGGSKPNRRPAATRSVASVKKCRKRSV